MGIRRADGRAATRNYIGVLSSVNCSATVVKAIEDHFRLHGLGDYPNVDGVVALPQSFGCAIGSKANRWRSCVEPWRVMPLMSILLA